MKKKNIFFIAIFVILISSITVVNIYPSASIFKKYARIASNYLPQPVVSVLHVVFSNKKNTKRIRNDFNVRFLKETQFKKINFKKERLKFLASNAPGYAGSGEVRQTFFIETHKENIFFIDTKSNITFAKLNDIKNNKNLYKKISNKFSLDNESTKVLDMHINKNTVFVSRKITINSCNYIVLDKAEVSYENLIFEQIFINKDECQQGILGGKIATLKENQVLLTTSADILANEDQSDTKPQDDASIFGKVLLINTDTLDYKIFSKGWRNSLGLLVDGEFILATDNGPWGGDEINLLSINKNYGWPIASLGATYVFDAVNQIHEMYLDHKKAGFEEPIHSFVPSLGITEIIKLENNFLAEWQDNYLVGTLNDYHLMRIKFNENRTKVLFVEKIFIGERIRDLTYDKKNKMVILSLESTGSLGILTSFEK
ncbi:PQQ-dependent sugar dehydrogenase [Pelagibacteraceae bacterium]|nr:PQQ-dependent sugar dehydrogenase [Pelagibacteraceae bacterium]